MSYKTDSNLNISSLVTGYHKKQILHGVDMEVQRGQIVALIGPNGCGKTTTLKAIAGVIPTWRGVVQFGGVDMAGMRPAERMARGLAFCPQGNRAFTSLTVEENIDIGGIKLPREEVTSRRDCVLEMFPALRDRLKDKAGVLSGGEQQMVSLARALMCRPSILMLDEPSLGLSPALLSDVFSRIDMIRKETNVGILVVEQKVRRVLDLADSCLALRLGEVAYSGPSRALRGDGEELKRIFL